MNCDDGEPIMNPSRMGWVVGGILATVLVGLLVPAIYQAREAARRTQSRNSLKHLGLALHNYQDTHGVLPPGGVFNADGVAFHEWTTCIAPYLDSGPWTNIVDSQIPWDDPRQVDLFRHGRRSMHFTNACVELIPRPDGLDINHYAASQTVLYRNSAESMRNWSDTSARLLVAEAPDHFLPVGCPYGWRDVTLGLGTNPDGFGGPLRTFAHCLMADGSVHGVSHDVAAENLEAMAGPKDQRPSADQVQRITEYPQLDLNRIWRIEIIIRREEHDTFEKPRVIVQRTSPDGRTVVVGDELPDLPAEPGSEN